MDNTDIPGNLDLADMLLVQHLDQGLWAGSDRSTELTPLYVRRYAGPRDRSVLTRHPFWELIYTFKGEGRFLGPEPLTLRPGSAVLVPPGIRHTEVSD
ncbi:MAG: AraC family ligand binding domain-containing protein, partial [Phycisphaerae bacterium]